MPTSRDILLVTWQGGGNVPPMLSLGCKLARWDHPVRVVGPASMRARVERAGLEFEPLPHVTELDESRGVAIEDQVDAFIDHLTDSALAEDVAASIDRRRPGVAVVDCMQLAAFGATEARGVPTAALAHLLPRVALGDASRSNPYLAQLNASRTAIGVAPLDEGVGIYGQLWSRCDRVLAATLERFDEAPGPLPDNLRYIGPIIEPLTARWTWDLPWSPDDPIPLVVVSFSSTYQHQEHQLQRAIDASASLDVHTVVTLGRGLTTSDVRAPDGVVVREWIPHADVLARAAALITHAGHSSIMEAIAHAVPMVCLPTGRDQVVNADRVAACGLGVALEMDAPSDQIAVTLAQVLASRSVHDALGTMAKELHALADHEVARFEVESMLERGTPSAA